MGSYASELRGKINNIVAQNASAVLLPPSRNDGDGANDGVVSMVTASGSAC